MPPLAAGLYLGRFISFRRAKTAPPLAAGLHLGNRLLKLFDLFWKTCFQNNIETKRTVSETKYCFQNKTKTKQIVSETKFFVSETKFCFQIKTETKQIVFETKFCFINKLWQTFSPRLVRPATKELIRRGEFSFYAGAEKVSVLL